MSVADSEISVEALHSPKRPRTEMTEGSEEFEMAETEEKVTEGAEEGFETAEAEEKKEESDDDEEDDEDYADEDWEENSKKYHCELCNEYGHFARSCSWTYLCPPFAKLPPCYERICWCCADVLEEAHPDTPDDEIAYRAHFKAVKLC